MNSFCCLTIKESLAKIGSRKFRIKFAPQISIFLITQELGYNERSILGKDLHGVFGRLGTFDLS